MALDDKVKSFFYYPITAGAVAFLSNAAYHGCDKLNVHPEATYEGYGNTVGGYLDLAIDYTKYSIENNLPVLGGWLLAGFTLYALNKVFCKK